MCLVIANLGKRLRQISKEAHLSLAMLAAYLNDVWFSHTNMYSHAGIVVYMNALSRCFRRC